MNDLIEPTLYIIMRTDIQDMNPGKAIAQGSHATDDFEAWVAVINQQSDQYGELLGEISTWREDRSFGRVIVLESSLDEMKHIVQTNDFAGLTTDPTYPWRNYYGDVFLSEEITAAWCFICNETVPSVALTELPLHR